MNCLAFLKIETLPKERNILLLEKEQVFQLTTKCSFSIKLTLCCIFVWRCKSSCRNHQRGSLFDFHFLNRIGGMGQAGRQSVVEKFQVKWVVDRTARTKIESGGGFQFKFGILQLIPASTYQDRRRMVNILSSITAKTETEDDPPTVLSCYYSGSP